MALLYSNKTYSQLPPFDPLYDSVFVDEFTSSSLNSSEWRLQYGWGHFYNANPITNWCGTNQVASLNMSFSDTNNRVISGGTCKLKMKKENSGYTSEIWTYPSPCTSSVCTGYTCLGSNPNTDACFKPVQIPFKYSNSMLHTLKMFKYGYFIIKFRIQNWSSSPYNAFIPNFWMYNGNSATVPWSEIDIYEIWGNNGQFTDNIHVNNTPYSTSGPSNDPIPNPPGEPFIDLSQWHTASVNWTPSYIDFYVDGNFIRRSTNAINQSLIEMPMMIECSIPQLFNCTSPDTVNTTFPIIYEIDYVKAYQPVLACDTDKVYCNVSATTFRSKIYKSLTIGGSGCNATFNNSTATAVGNDYVLLNEGFEVGNNMNMTIKVEPCWSGMKLEQRSADFKQVTPTNFIENYQELRIPED